MLFDDEESGGSFEASYMSIVSPFLTYDTMDDDRVKVEWKLNAIAVGVMIVIVMIIVIIMLSLVMTTVAEAAVDRNILECNSFCDVNAITQLE
jgi:hypothetical protein